MNNIKYVISYASRHLLFKLVVGRKCQMPEAEQNIFVLLLRRIKMKEEMVKCLEYRKIIMTLALVLITTLMFFSETEAQRRRDDKIRRDNRAERVLPFLHNYTRIAVGPRNYYYNAGTFYVRSRRGYSIIQAPVGARIRTLPVGFAQLSFGGLNYYYFNGTYFRYFPDQHVYIVVENPSNAQNVSNLKLDQVKLYNGSVLYGIFQSGTDSTITLRVGNEDEDIYISDIISINFAPSINGSTQ